VAEVVALVGFLVVALEEVETPVVVLLTRHLRLNLPQVQVHRRMRLLVIYLMVSL